MTNVKPNDTTSTAHRWGIILSGGNGTRLRDLVYRRRADYLPKQYLNFVGKRSMLEHTLHRAEKLIPAQKLLVVIAKEHLQFDEVRRQVARDRKSASSFSRRTRIPEPGYSFR